MAKPGKILVNKINKSLKKNHYVKIGGKAYNKWVSKTIEELKEKRGDKKTNTDEKLQNKLTSTRRKFKKYLPKLYERQYVDDVRGLLRYNHQFSENDVKRVKRIIKRRVRKPGKKIVEIKFKGDSKFSDRVLTLGDEESFRVKNLIKLITGGQINEIEETGSDRWFDLDLKQIEDFKITTLPEPEFKNVINKNGRFFRYLNTTKINLERYQIISSDSNMDILKEHCLIYALKMLDVKDSLLNSIKSKFQCGSYFAKKNLSVVADILQKNIILTCFDGVKTRIEKFGKYETVLKLCLYKDHYFVNEKTKYSLYCSKNYILVKDEKDFHKIIKIKKGKYFQRINTNEKKCDSLALVKNLLETNNFIKDHPILKSVDKYQKYNDKVETLDILDREQKPYEYKIKNEKGIMKNIFYADCETDTSVEHKLFLIGVVKEKENMNIDDVKVYLNNDNRAFYKFMDYVYNQSKQDTLNIIYFHNLKFDYHVLAPYIYHSKAPCEKDSQIYEVEILFRKRKFSLRDSYKLASFPISKFQKTFQLPKSVCKKESIAYNYYKLSNINDDCVDVNIYKKFLTKDKQKIFMSALKSNMEFNYNKKNNTFDPIEYYKYYLLYDVFVLALGMIKFKNIISDITKNKLDLHDFLTISSITYKYMGMSGCFDGVEEITGNLREFVGKAVTGGRVQVNTKYKKQIIENKIADYDACSLYPSAISRMCKERGLPTGRCKKIRC